MLLTAPLIGLLSAAAWFDVRTYRIPNFLTFPGVVLGLVLNLVLPSGIGLAAAALGFALALFALLPLYLMRIWGAGDVKLMAVVGAFLGPAGLLWSLLATMVFGGLAAAAIALRRKSSALLLTNLRSMAWQLFLNVQLRTPEAVAAPVQSAGKVAYALPILLGTAAYVAYCALVQ